jgi:hypothetical protein
MQHLKQKIKEKETENVEVTQINRSKYAEREEMLLNVGRRLANILKNSLICSNIEILDKLLTLIQQNPKKFEM